MRLAFTQLAQFRGLTTLVDGSFDPLHAGHLNYFTAAKAFGHPVICNICPDAYTATKHPILLPASERAAILDQLRCVDHVHVSDQPTSAVLRTLQPRIYAKGDGWKDRLPSAEQDICATFKIAVEFTGPSDGSSTAILKRLQPDVYAFERLVQGQALAKKPWEPTAAVPYDFQSRVLAEGRHPDVILETFGHGPFLDYGCGPDAILVRLLRERGAMASGVDSILKPEWQCLQPHWDNGPEEFVGEFPVIICREVFEHIPVLQLQPIIRRFKKFHPQYVYLTTRFAKAPQHFLSVDTSDDLDPTHITMLNQDFLRTLFVLEGFTRRADLEAQMDWQQKGRCLVYERVPRD